MAEVSARARRALILLAVLYAGVVVPVGIHKGGDFAAHLRLSDRLLHDASAYGVTPVTGVWWPPFALLLLTPFAALSHVSLALAKGCWALVSVACVAWSVARAQAGRWGPVALAVAAVAVPLQTNFEHLNINALLLALVVATGADLGRGSDARAGVWVGMATALKVFPALFLAYFAYRRRWRALGIGLAVATGATIAAVLPYGLPRGIGVLQEWWEIIRQGGLAMSPGNQSLPALATRLGAPQAEALLLDILCLAGAAALLGRPGRGGDLPYEIGAVSLLMVLLTPIAWVHYYVLALPAWLVVLDRPAPTGNRRVWYAALATAGILTSGVLTLGPYHWRRALLETSVYTWGALLLLGLLVLVRAPRPSPQRA